MVRRILDLTRDLSGQPDKPPAKLTGWGEDLPRLVPDFTEGTQPPPPQYQES
ncbi:hypothetical protein GCM10027057_22680 [Marisediminicola antarctica]